MGALAHICVSAEKGGPKTPVDEIELVENFGLRGDAHAGAWHRQVSILDCADIDAMRQRGLQLEPGAFGENLAIQGLELEKLGIGSVASVGDAHLKITQIGKVCHNRCAIYYSAGDCIMPRAGIFARVVKGGSVRRGAAVQVVSSVARDTTQAAVVTISDRCSRGETVDTAGPAVAEMLRNELEAHIAWTGIRADDEKPLADLLINLADRGIDLVVTVGGTGFASRDTTPEATRQVIEREAPGLAEEMRRRSAEITPHALLQRGVCGIRGRSLIINLPGSRKAAEENLSFILAALPHAIKHLRDEDAHLDDRRTTKDRIQH